MTRMATFSAATLSLCLVAGCQSQASEERSAIVTNPSPEVVTELERTISTSLYGVPVSLTESAFTDSSVLTLQPAQQSRPDVRLASGRTMDRPEQFRLIAIGDACLLEKMTTGERFQLQVTRCSAVTRDSQ